MANEAAPHSTASICITIGTFATFAPLSLAITSA